MKFSEKLDLAVVGDEALLCKRIPSKKVEPEESL
jgi:hypothetical protein